MSTRTPYPSFRGRIRWPVAGLLAASLLTQCAGPSHQVQATRQGRATTPTPPQMVRSTEATETQLNLAHEQGYAEEQAEKWYLRQATPAAHQQPAGGYLIAYTLSAPEGWYEPSGEVLVWHPPAPDATAHLRVFVRDGADNRPLPGLAVQATFTPAGGPARPVLDVPAGWYPLANAYGENVALPPGSYHLRLAVSRLPFRRHDPYNGDRFAHPVVVELDHVPVGAALASQTPLSDLAAANTELAQAQGDVEQQVRAALYADANAGAAHQAGDYLVSYAVNYALATWDFDEKDKLRYTLSTKESVRRNAHVEAVVQEARTGRLVPGLHLLATLTGEHGQALGTEALPFEWHPWAFHYGENWRVPRSGSGYRLRLRAAAPSFRRYGRTAGRVFAQGFDASFDSVRVVVGAK